MRFEPFTRKVFYYETDKMGIVHHSNYIRWFEEARVYALDMAGLPFENVEAMGVLSPVLSAECVYKLPFRFNERFFIKALIDEFGGARFSVTYNVFGEDGVTRVTGKTSHCFVDENMRPLRIKKTHPNIYSVYEELFKTGEDLYG
ncbi:MAG: acyl-CoA thioesterase [Oscillospiraceae bacterium]|nr:acyl-CoA thioesterase [Oscillospiraceae bacterium]